MTSTTGLVAAPEPTLVKTDVLGRMNRTHEQRQRILDEYERSGLSGPKFAALCGVKYQRFANWLQRRNLRARLIKRMKSIIAAICLIAIVRATGAELSKREQTHDAILASLTMASSNIVERLEIFYFPEDINTTVAVTRERLESKYWSKTTIASFQESEFRNTLLRELQRSSLKQRANSSSDLRWGCVFYDSNGDRVLSIYFDKFADGFINDIAINSNGKLLDLLRNRSQLTRMKRLIYHGCLSTDKMLLPYILLAASPTHAAA